MLRALAFLTGLTLASLAVAAESPVFRSAQSEARLLSDTAAVAPGESFRLGLALRPAPGWHTYWRNAGDAGAPAEIALDLPPGATAGEIAWPAPERIPYGPLVNFGYKAPVLLAVPVRLPATLAPGDLLRIEAEATWLICEQVCIPETARFTLALPVAARAVPAFTTEAVFTAADGALPRPWPGQVAAGAAAGRASLTLDAPFLNSGTVREAFFFPDAPGLIRNDAPQPLRREAGRIRLDLALADGATPASVSGTLTLVDGGGQRAAFVIGAPVTGPPAGQRVPGLALAMLMALAGGVILNLMPCVFPVLAMKAMGLAKLSGAAGRRVRAHAANMAAGMVLSFAVLGAALAGLRLAGLSAGWGFQFTEPAFVAAMAWLVLAVGLNLSGLFALPGTGAGQALAGRPGHAGAFLTGVLAVALAAPCTAPFMAAALGAAALLPPAEGMLIFVALGLGMALPYLLLAAAPGLAARLPRPGPWMERLRQALAFPMYATAAWLVSVLAAQAGPEGVLLGLLGGVVLAAGLFALGQAQRAGGGRWGPGLAAVALLAALALLPRLSVAPAAAASPGVEPWSAARVAELRAAGRPVLVNATAAWCITCQVNERLAFQAPAVQAAFAATNLAYLKADWTRGDAAIGALLREHGRDGVPLYLYWAPGAAQPVLLPQLLTEGLVLAALTGG
jgi:thiol:disulfide interchange protein DsbD